MAADLRAFRQWAVDRLRDLERAVAATTDARARLALVASTVAELEVERDRVLEAMHLRRWESWDRACAQLDELSGGGTESASCHPDSANGPPPPRIAAASSASRGRTRISCICPCRF